MLEIWTAGGCQPNPGAGGWGWTSSDGRGGCGGDPETTNNRMELTAILMALRAVLAEPVTIYSDSQYCVNGLTAWRAKWAKAGWMRKGAPLMNRDLWLLLEVELLRARPTLKWTRGRNDRAYRLALIGRKQFT